MYDPCSQCRIRTDNQCAADCKVECDYARVAKENRDGKNNREMTLDEIKEFLRSSSKNGLKKSGKVFVLKLDELKQLFGMIVKLVG